MKDPRLQLMDDLLTGVDGIDGACIEIGPKHSGAEVYLHTTEQIRAWLAAEREVLLSTIAAEQKAG